MDRRDFGRALAGLAAAVSGTTRAAEWELGPFVKDDAHNPVLGPGTGEFVCPVRGERVRWEEKDVFNPAAVVRDGKVGLLYRAEDRVGRFKGTSRLGLAWSDDGFTFERRNGPVLYPDNDEYREYEWEGGIEDPRLVETADGKYVLTYTAYDGRTARLCSASSADLVTWKKHGPVFPKKFRHIWSKSGAIVCRRDGERLVAARIKDRYWMYWGDACIYLAHSEDLVDWTPVTPGDPGQAVRSLVKGFNRGLDKTGILPALSPRAGRFDSILAEPGPPALLTASGILLLYNGANRRALGDRSLPPWTYSAGQALFDPDDPGRLLGRADSPFLLPDRPYEISGQVARVCFAEALVPFRNRWLLYYGAADSNIAAAIV